MISDAGLDHRKRARIEPLPRRRLQRAEALAGNERTASLVEMPGLVAWVHSAPSGPGAGGGDVHYLSLCPSGIVSRIALADVSGHGQSVVSLGEKLRELMLRHLTALEQVGIMRDLNRAVSPCRFRAARNEWSWVERGSVSEKGRTVGAPLGLLDESGYDRVVFKPQGGDLLLLYTDGVTEAVNDVGDELGRDGLMSILAATEARSAEALGGQLTSALRLFRGNVEPADDETVIVLESLACPYPTGPSCARDPLRPGAASGSKRTPT